MTVFLRALSRKNNENYFLLFSTSVSAPTYRLSLFQDLAKKRSQVKAKKEKENFFQVN